MTDIVQTRSLERAAIVAIAGLGITQVIGWGSTYYLLTILAPLIGQDLALSPELVSSGMSIMLVLGAVLGPTVGRLMDMHGARPVMATGSGLAALGLALLGTAQGAAGYFVAWIIVGVASTAILYPAAFTALTQVTPHQARRAISLLTLPGGLASTIFWPLTTMLLDQMGWREICLLYAALHLLVCLTIHLTVIPSGGAARGVPRPQGPIDPGLPPIARRRAFILFATMLALNSFLVTGILNQFQVFLTGLGQGTEAAVLCGMMFGISQVTARVVEIRLGARYDALYGGVLVNFGYPLAFLILATNPGHALFGIAFAVIFGACNGVLTIVRGALVLSLFGVSGYGENLGRVTVAQGVAGAMAPIAMAGAIHRMGSGGAIWLGVAAGGAAFIAMVALFRHATRARAKPNEN